MRLISNLWLAVNLSVLPVDLHYLEESSHLLRICLLVDIDDVKQSQDACPDALYFVNQLGKLDLDRHKEDRDTIVEIELVPLEVEPSLEYFHRLIFSLGHLPDCLLWWRCFQSRSFLLSGLTLQLAELLDRLLLGSAWKGELHRLRLMDQEV